MKKVKITQCDLTKNEHLSDVKNKTTLHGYVLVQALEKALIYLPQNDNDKLSCSAIIIAWTEDNGYRYGSDDLSFINFDDMNLCEVFVKWICRLQKCTCLLYKTSS